MALAAEQAPGLIVRLYEWAHVRFPQLVDCRPIVVQEALEGAGFSIANSERRSSWGLPLDICLGIN